MESLPDGSAVLAIAGKTKYMSKSELSEQLSYAQQIDTVFLCPQLSCGHSLTARMHH